DNGYLEGMEVPIYYDPMLSKLITYGKNRNEAIAKMREAIANYIVDGVATTLDFGAFVMEHQAFISGDFDTHFVKNYFTAEALKEAEAPLQELAAKLSLYAYLTEREQIKLSK
ncbi:MAG: biotin carboxylase, partial [Flavobacteriaceae bacterium]|nr:biotin carboxylase [Flavobacteriaceae bacterium]